MMKTAKRISFTIVVSTILILMTAFSVSGTVISQSKNEMQAQTRYYRVMEQNYVYEVRELLAEEGYADSGVTMTEVVDIDGSRSYTVTIHHRKISMLSEERKEELLRACNTLNFADENCMIFHIFLEEDF